MDASDAGGAASPPPDRDRVDAFRRTWRDARGEEWSARVDRLSMSCGACDVTRYLHIDAPDGARWTFTLAPDASLEGVPDAALQRMVEGRATPPA